jgi:hypothetical protein
VFLSVQFTDIAAFAGLVAAGLLLRRKGTAHKRLLLLATLYISDAGFARCFGPEIRAWLGVGFWATAVRLYFANDLLALGLGAYDLITRRRLHPAYVGGLAWTVLLQTIALQLLFAPQWASVAVRLIGQ